jgi:nicotinic acid mononucleotide adenylyltransferase
MSSFGENPPEKVENVVFSFQGAFGPPTFGHYISMKLFAEQVLKDYPRAKNIEMLFMPTAASSSKPHLIETQISRLEILKIFCDLLKKEETFKDKMIDFEASEIEYDLYKEQEPDKKSTATILTIDKLNDNLINDYPNTTNNALCIGMGYDNMMQLPYWQGIDQYKDKVAKIYVGYRNLTEEEEGKTKLFNIGSTQLRFETALPSWKQEETEIQTKTKEVTNEPLTYSAKLPDIVIVGENNDKSEIPPTSSSMMRHFIYKYINNENDKESSMNKIKKIMFGNKNIENIDEIFNNMLEYYKKLHNDYIKIFNPKKNYETEFESYESSIGKEPSHGGRKPPKKRSYKKKRSNKKFRSLRKRRSYKRV